MAGVEQFYYSAQEFFWIFFLRMDLKKIASS